MNTITVLTATRAEYGLLKPVILGLRGKYDVKVVATGAHLSPEFGETYREIEKDGIVIDKKIPILLSSDSPVAISKSMALAVSGFADYFDSNQTDALLVLGDRYETLAVCIAAMNERIPIIHLYGGDTTEGAIDEAIRHSITKLSYLHLVCTEEAKKRVLQMGENPNRVYVVGSLGVENALKQKMLSKAELEKSIGMVLGDKYSVVTFHPVTLENSSAEEQCMELIDALEEFQNTSFIITKANADADGRIINILMGDFARRRSNVKLFDSLGSERYLSAIKYADMVIGNSSSGLSEVPSFGVPTVNIGDRQRGRLKPRSVIDCEPTKESIIQAIRKASSKEFRDLCIKCKNPYGDGKTTPKIVTAIDEMFTKGIDIKKKFYNIL